MSSAPIIPQDVPPYLIQPLIPEISIGDISCAQALGSEVYVGCTDGELLRYALQADNDPGKLESYSLLSRQSLPNGKPIDELVLIPYLSRVLILSDRQIHFYTLPSLDPVPNIKPIRHVETFAVDHQHLMRPAPLTHDPSVKLQSVDLCVIKRSAIALYSLSEERLAYSREIPFQPGAQLARRTGQYLCVADGQYYNIVDLQTAQMFPLLPINQAADDPTPVKPFITVVSEIEFLMLSWTGASTLGMFITGEGDPVRGTLEWLSHPLSVCLDYPHITTLLPNGTIEIHSVETQSIIQVISAPVESDAGGDGRIGLVASAGGYLVPSSEQSEKMRKTKLRFDRK
ncbi:hypothetical protein HYDPIDRAFT_176932 [Hydnomerulius pinastri MD-312]|uniref:CNH domain-containing protein n=1 Tax=Hydnomerulius pinastri MD-312 TaxID=994086 RepID=A0A0C9WCC5_9AGAM|nr:hypothetical protein HYDPIDRAFT_176932 [Hydnomerulius pinastri MD-312]